jgi:prepilin-type processing-associated H-X9-DG protein
MNASAFKTKKPPADSRLPRRPRSGEREFAAKSQGRQMGPTLSETKSLEWGSEMHRHAGNLAFSDGHVEPLTNVKLREALARTGDTNNPVWLPNVEANKSTGTL